jgi:hypothetical protein
VGRSRRKDKRDSREENRMVRNHMLDFNLKRLGTEIKTSPPHV